MTIAASWSNQALERDPVRDRLHDLRNLFGVVSSGAHLLADGQAPERRAMVLQAMDGAAARGSEILSTMLAGLSDREPEICLLPDRLSKLAPLLMTMAGDGVHLRLDLATPPTQIECPGEQLDRVILELVANARRAIPSSGSITVRVRTTREAIWLIVADTGTGMGDRQVARMLGREPAPYAGRHGTGLRQVRDLVDRAKGRLRLRSRIGAGTVVAMMLPIHADAARDYGHLRMGAGEGRS